MNYPVALVSGVARNTRPPAGLALARASASGGVRARNGREKRCSAIIAKTAACLRLSL